MTFLSSILVLCIASASALASPARCTPARSRTTHVVCVVDERGRPVAGADVHATRMLVEEGFGDIATTVEDLGHVRSDATGRAAFAVPALRRSWLASEKEASRTAFATVNGWPTQEATNQTIVVGPPRTIRIRTKHRACDGTTWVRLTFDSDERTVPDLAPQPDGTFTAELGPGPYSVTASLCVDGHTASTSKDFIAARVRGVFDL